MVIRDQQQALSVAVEMEKRAIRTYERALMIVRDEAVAAGVRDILSDERGHLELFSSMAQGVPAPAEERLLTEAMAADALFSGGVMEMARREGFQSVEKLYQFAADSERSAVKNYTAFAELSTDENVKQAFLSIAQEEAGHLAALEHQLQQMQEA
ncbi:MAG: ferritin family protein [Clostridia bacterium]|nr:ferritin family protein [Clostridia bacterium]